MGDMLEEFAREKISEILRELPVNERIKGLSADDLLAVLPPEQLEELFRWMNNDKAAANHG